MGFFTQQAEQSLERGKGLEAMPGVFGPLKVLVACQQQSGYGIPCQHLHNPHCNPMLCLSCAVLGPYLCHAMLCHTKLLTPCWVTQYCTVLMCPGLSHALVYVKTILNTPPAQSGGASALLRSRAEYSSCGTQNATKFVQAHQQAHHEGPACLWCNKLHFFEQPASSNAKCPGEGSTWLNKMCLFFWGL